MNYSIMLIVKFKKILGNQVHSFMLFIEEKLFNIALSLKHNLDSKRSNFLLKDLLINFEPISKMLFHLTFNNVIFLIFPLDFLIFKSSFKFNVLNIISISFLFKEYLKIKSKSIFS